MIVTGKHLSRRTFLRRAGTVIGLPLLDAMTPALAWARNANRQPPTRLCFVYVPNGMVMANWQPAKEGKDFEFTPILKPLEPFREHTLVLSSLMDHNANALGDGGGDHARASASFLTGAHPRESGSDIFAGVSADQIAAQAIGHETRLPSLELGLEDTRIVGLCDGSYSCAYTSSISWHTYDALPPCPIRGTSSTPCSVASIAAPDPATAAARSPTSEHSRRRVEKPPPDVDRGRRGSTQDRRIPDVNPEVERGIQRASNRSHVPVPSWNGHRAFRRLREHARLMFDLLALAFQSDATRIATMIGRESSIRSYDQLGIPEAHHQLSHHRNDPPTSPS